MADRRLARLLALTLVSGCTLAPAYHPPQVAAPAAFKEAGIWQAANPGKPIASDSWWQGFDDPVLDGLETQLAADSPTLASAYARYQAARGYLVTARAGLFPQIDAGTSFARNRQSDHRPLRGSNQPDLYSTDSVGGSASFELDLWRRVRNSVAAGEADVAASGDDLAAIRLSLQARLASNYMLLRGLDRQAELLAMTVEDFTRADRMTRRRLEGGIASGVETGQSGAQLAEAEAQLADVANARALVEHAIASLVGTPASSFALAPAAVNLAVPDVPAGLPSTLLERRPDVAAAERRMFAANRRIGIARAAFFPQIALLGTGGFQNAGQPGLFAAPNIFWSLGPAAVLNVFDGGRRRGQLAVARANWEQATADYRDRVLTAFQDVEDGLSQLHLLGEAAAATDRAVTMASQAERLSLNRYEKGAASYLDVLTAQTTALRVRRQAISLDTQRLQASVRLAAALGGGWQGTNGGAGVAD